MGAKFPYQNFLNSEFKPLCILDGPVPSRPKSFLCPFIVCLPFVCVLGPLLTCFWSWVFVHIFYNLKYLKLYRCFKLPCVWLPPLSIMTLRCNTQHASMVYSCVLFSSNSVYEYDIFYLLILFHIKEIIRLAGPCSKCWTHLLYYF